MGLWRLRLPGGPADEVGDEIRAAEDGPPEERLYLLGIRDDESGGRTIVAAGNPNLTPVTAVHAPGILVNLIDARDQIGRIEIRREADDRTPDTLGDVSVVLWMDYDTPTLDEAVWSTNAQEGAPALFNFIEGVRTAYQLDPSVYGRGRVVGSGHSYGGLPFSYAAQLGPVLDIDDLGTLGAPGLGVPHVSYLSLNGRVWSGAFDNDFVANWGPWVHNIAPHRPEFGGNQMAVKVPLILRRPGFVWRQTDSVLRSNAARSHLPRSAAASYALCRNRISVRSGSFARRTTS